MNYDQELKSSETPSTKKSGKLSIIIGCLFSVACFYWIAQSVDSQDVFEKLRVLDHQSLFFAFILTIISYALRAFRWPYFFDAGVPSYWGSFRCVQIGFLMNNVLPARAGELIRAHVGGKVTKQSRMYVLATIAGERLFDGLTISALFGVLFALGSSADERSHGWQLSLVSLLFVAAAVFTLLLIVYQKRFLQLLHLLHKKITVKAIGSLIEWAESFMEGLSPMAQPKKILQLSILSLLVWTVELAVYWQVAEAFHEDLTIGGIALFLAAINFSSLVPSAPAGLGVIEAFASAALVQIGVSKHSAIVLVGTQHLIQIVVVALLGSASLLVQQRIQAKELGQFRSENGKLVSTES
jgi:glycosyltransferase 2 family protein